MALLLCAATPFEIGPITDWLQQQTGTNVRVLITGVGLAASTYALTRAVLTDRPDFILQAGVAGALDTSLPLAKIVAVANESFGDLGVTEGGSFRSLFDLKLTDGDMHPWQSGKLRNEMGALRSTGLTIVDGVTVNEITTNRERIDFYRDGLGASVESMEGGALHYVALQERIPFLQLRALSNFVGERDKSQWVMGMAIAALNGELQRILTKFINT